MSRRRGSSSWGLALCGEDGTTSVLRECGVRLGVTSPRAARARPSSPITLAGLDFSFE